MTPPTNEQIAATLRDKQLRTTAPRVAVMRVLLEAGCPLTQHQIAERLGTASPNKTTIYRTLVSLMEANLAHKAFVQQRQWHFEPAHQCHPHFTCTRCQRTECLYDVAIPLVQLPEGLTMQRQQIRIEGICADCRV